MDLATELKELIRAYVEGTRTITDVRDWLAVHVQDIEDADDPVAEDLSGDAWTLLAEFDCGHRTEEDLRSELSLFLAGRNIAVAGAAPSAITIADAVRAQINVRFQPSRLSFVPGASSHTDAPAPAPA